MRIKEGDVNRVIYFVAVDATDLKTRETSLTNADVWYSNDGGSATQMTTPTITAVDATNMPGVFKLAIDEAGMVAISGTDEAEVVLHITADEMLDVTRVIDIFKLSSSALALIKGVIDNAVTITQSGDQVIYRGDNKYLQFNLGTDWDLTGLNAVFIMKTDPKADNSTAKVNRNTTITDATNGLCEITLSTTETNTIGEYWGEIETHDPGAQSTTRKTALQFKIIIRQDVRQ